MQTKRRNDAAKPKRQPDKITAALDAAGTGSP